MCFITANHFVGMGNTRTKDNLVVSIHGNYDTMIKILLIGDAKVGKSAILEKFMTDSIVKEYECTIGMEFKTKIIMIDDKRIKLQIWDTNGSKYRDSTASLIIPIQLTCKGCILIFDITNKQSLECIKHWYSYISIYDGWSKCYKILVGNKCDLYHERVIDYDQAQKLSNRWNMDYVETSIYADKNAKNPLLVHGYLRIQRNKLLPQENSYYDVPDLVMMCCLDYFLEKILLIDDLFYQFTTTVLQQ